MSPTDVKGQKILMADYGDNIWMFNPETRRTRKLGSHMKKKKVMGSDFTYEDQAGGRYVEKYTGIVLKEEKENGLDCFVLELKPTEKGPSYGKIVAWVGKKDYITRRVDFYRKSESGPFKRLTSEDVKKAGKKDVPFKVTMTNLEDKTETVNYIIKNYFWCQNPCRDISSRRTGKMKRRLFICLIILTLFSSLYAQQVDSK